MSSRLPFFVGLACSAFVLSLLGACSRNERSPIERGRATFVRNCSSCHGLDGRGAVSVSASMPVPPRNLTDPAFHAERTDEQLRAVIKNGKGSMPAFGVLLGPEQLNEVLRYIRTLPSSSTK